MFSCFFTWFVIQPFYWVFPKSGTRHCGTRHCGTAALRRCGTAAPGAAVPDFGNSAAVIPKSGTRHLGQKHVDNRAGKPV